MLSYSAPALSELCVSRLPSELVGVGRFELPASSSRRQRDTRMACTGTACTGGSLSAGIRQHPPKTGAVVTQFVTQTWRRSCAAARQVTALQSLRCQLLVRLDRPLAINPVLEGGSNCRPSVFQV